MALHDHFSELKHIFINLISQSDYPHIGWIDFGNFCREVGIEGEGLSSNSIDNAFIGTKSQAVTQGSSK
jgi:hypothetical protein